MENSEVLNASVFIGRTWLQEPRPLRYVGKPEAIMTYSQGRGTQLGVLKKSRHTQLHDD